MLEPMLATLSDAPLDDPDWVYEPKYDGIRAIAEVGVGGQSVRLWSRLGNEKTKQFPEVIEALRSWAASHREGLVLDGEIVALDASGRPIGFQNLQGRIHVLDAIKARRIKPADAGPTESAARKRRPGDLPPVAFLVFDLLRLGHHDLRELPLTDRRELLERLLRKGQSATLRMSEQVRGDGRTLQGRALAEGWEGLIAKRADSRYLSGKRSADWRKLKLVHEQEFVVGGWTEPRQSRLHFGALLLGVYEAQDNSAATDRRSRPLTYVGHVGTGFNDQELQKLMTLLTARSRTTTPFTTTPASNERPHWVEPTLVVQVRFTEWTADGVLRHPVYLGLRDDKAAADVRREERAATPLREASRGKRAAAPPSKRPTDTGGSKKAAAAVANVDERQLSDLVETLQDLERARKDGVLQLQSDQQLKVTNLHKPFWPKQRLTKGDLFRYYVRVAPFLLPTIADRPLVMKRFPNGVTGKPFYQHRVEEAPAGVRIEAVASEDARPQIIGGSLLTLLYTTQLAAISQDPWFSRVGSPLDADFVALDLDPPEGTDFRKILSVARWVHDELERLGVPSGVKTSGADGLHIYVPMPPGTPFDAGQLFGQIVATLVADKHPKAATVERSVKARGGRIYIDFMQNGRGKTLASAYSARASDYAGVSTPLSWKEVEAGVRREDFTIETVPGRLADVGDLWGPLRTSPGADLSAIATLDHGRRK